MDDVLGSGWQLILGPQADAELLSASKSTAVKGLGIHQLGSAGLDETDSVLMNWFALNDCSAVIVRPDHYIYGAAKTASELASQLNDLNRIR